jgi:predicted glycoside hydrolase/deacetylase ChbG (UPF0249 family)
MNNRFILCADDYALSPGVSRGIIEALIYQRISATSAITTCHGWFHAARALHPFQSCADIGLHLNLTLGSPLGPMPRLAPTGRLPSLRHLVQAALLNRLPKSEVCGEISRQIDAFSTAMGRAPDFVDGHQHVHLLPGIRQWLIEDLQRRGFAGFLWLRNSADVLWKIFARRTGAAKASLVACLGGGFAAAARAGGFAINDGFAGFSRFDASRDCGRDFATYLLVPGAVHLVMCHPGYAGAELAQLDAVTHARERELAFLLSDQFVQAIASRQLELGRFGAIAPLRP